MIALAEELAAAGRQEVHLFVEYQAEAPEGAEPIPAIDVMLVGRHPESGLDSVLLVELKQWATAVRSVSRPDMVDVPQIKKPKKHPSDQLRVTYDFLISKDGPLAGADIEYLGLSFLHNAADDGVRDLLDSPATSGPHGTFFTAESRLELRELVRERFAEGDSRVSVERVLRRIGLRNTPLLEAMTQARGEDSAFRLRGNQRTVVRQVGMALDGFFATERREKAVFIVTGGAGTGKTAIGLALRDRLRAAGRNVWYTSGSRAFNAALRAHLGLSEARFRRQFAFFNSFVDPPEPRLDVLICDEAHRLREKSTSRWANGPTGTRPQVEELIEASEVTVFFLDEAQTLRRDEVGTRALITQAAGRFKVTPQFFALKDYFRSGGSTLYPSWVKELLGIEGDTPRPWAPDGLMHLELAESPAELEHVIRTEAAAGASARMVAGFSWGWSRPRPDGTLVDDIRIGDWHRPWNARAESEDYGGEAPPALLWGVRPKGSTRWAASTPRRGSSGTGAG